MPFGSVMACSMAELDATDIENKSYIQEALHINLL